MQALIVSLIAANLFLGSSGTQVTALQQILNRDPDTTIASTGPGSRGYETNYFGSRTKAAVVRFQEKYASEILLPTGLAQGNGYVGSYTRAKLNALSAGTSTGSAIPHVSPPGGASTTPVGDASLGGQNPNLKNLDTFLTAIDTVATKQGIPAATLALIKEQIRKDVATTTDLHAAFLKLLQDTSHQSIQNNSFMGGVLATVVQTFDTVFMPPRVHAAVGTPFGGALLFSFYCNQSGTWLITLEPLPPSYAALLTYEPESQAFLSYNIPYTSWLLGEYTPGAGTCIVGGCPYCYSVPSEGMITPMVGSSPD